MNFHNEKEIRKFVAPEILFGIDSRLLAASYIQHFGGGKTLIVTDRGVSCQPWFNEILQSLEDERIPYLIFQNISENPRMEEVHDGAELFLREECRLILAIGGGSPMDCAKGIGIVCTNGGKITQYEGVDQVVTPAPPLICIPSTAGTAADLSQFSIITESNQHYKMAIISKSIVPDLSLSDPVVLTTMPSYLSACTGIDALVHAIEAYVSNASSTLTDMMALDAIELVSRFLKKSIDQPENLDYRNAMMTASMKAGLAFSNASLGVVHAMAHSLGGLKNLPHGECNSLLLPSCVQFNYSSVPERFREIGSRLGISSEIAEQEYPERLDQTLKGLIESVGITGGLKERGVQQEDIQALAERALQDACMVTNPREMTLKDVETLFGAALG